MENFPSGSELVPTGPIDLSDEIAIISLFEKYVDPVWFREHLLNWLQTTDFEFLWSKNLTVRELICSLDDRRLWALARFLYRAYAIGIFAQHLRRDDD